MALLAGMLRQRGIDGSNGLVQDCKVIQRIICQELTLLILYKRCLLTYLEMVKTENQLIDGLNSGKTQLNNVGKELMSSMNIWKSARCGNNSRIFNSVTPKIMLEGL